MLTAHAKSEVMAHTTVGAHLTQTVEVLAGLEVELIRNQLRVLAVLEILLPVEEVVGDFELARILDDGHDTVNLLVRERARALVEVDVGLLQHEIGKATADTLDRRQREHHLVAPIDIGVQHTKDMLKLLSLHHHRHLVENTYSHASFVLSGD